LVNLELESKIDELKVLIKLLEIDIPVDTDNDIFNLLNVYRLGELCLDGRISEEHYDLLIQKLSEINKVFY